MKEKDRILFWDTAGLEKTGDIEKRCNVAYLEEMLEKILPKEDIRVASVNINTSGRYKKRTSLVMRLLGAAKPVENLPPYCEVVVERKTGKFIERTIIWSPLAWNNRFAGTAGGGTVTGGAGHITAPNNTSRGLFLPVSIINGFTAATNDAGNPKAKHNWAQDAKTGALHWDLIQNWSFESTHFMTQCGKAVAEILHRRSVEYSYLHGGSGGGRQSMIEAQRFPEDYDGIWASCPAVNWTKFMMCSLWPLAVMNSYKRVLKPAKIEYFKTAVLNSVGGRDAYFKLQSKVDFDPDTVIGHKTKDGVIDKQDAAVMREMWNGPHRQNGEWLWYGFRPGVKFWNIGIPIGAFYYTLVRKKPKAFLLFTSYARWAAKNPKQKFNDINMADFENIFDLSVKTFSAADGGNADLQSFATAGGKLMIDHGTDDPLIPVDGTIDYYRRMCEIHGGEDKAREFCRLYITPGDNHGNCYGNGPGITETDGMKALINWVENGIAPEALRVVQVNNKSGETICERKQAPFKEQGKII